MVAAIAKRFASSATRLPSVAVSHLPQFPPNAALFQSKDIPKPPFDSYSWAASQPPPPSACVAFVHRLGLASVISSPALIQQACTHPSFLSLHRQLYPDDPRPATNAQLAPLGNALMGMFASEFVHAVYPYLPTKVWKAAVTAFVGPTTCASVAQETGATHIVRWHRTSSSGTHPPVMHADALASVPRSITALIYQKHSLHSAREFVHSYFLSRQIDIQSMIKFIDPKKALLEMVQKFGHEKPVSRLLKETGRFSNSPVYVVAIFSGADKLGEGHGSSLKMAEFRAAEDALHRVYLTRTPDQLIQLPSSTFPAGPGDVFQPAQEAKYDAPGVTMPELSYTSSDKSQLRPYSS